MKILLAFDSFKGTIDSPQVCSLVEERILSKIPDAEVIKLPLADGGENTASILAEALGGGMKLIGNVQGPLEGMKVVGGYGNIPSMKTAIVEMAVASGIALVDPDELKPMDSSTFGTGQLLKDVFESDYETVFLTLGGSATNDGGIGAATALGWTFLDSDGNQLIGNANSLSKIAKIVPPQNSVKLPTIKCLCDVKNPLFGLNGAAHIFGPQKGADKDQIDEIDAGLRNFAEVVKKDLAKDISELPGAGAAGGFGGGAVAFLDAELVPGIDTIMDWLDFEKHLLGADWLITGEGCLDDTSFQGKVLSGVSKAVADSDVKLAAIAGRIKASCASLTAAGVEIAEASAPSMIPDAMAFANAEELLKEAADRVVERILQ